MSRWSLAACACVAIVASSFCFADEAEEGFTSIFNGKDLTGWKGDEKYWSVQEGALTAQTTDVTSKDLTYNTFLVWQDKQPANFELRAKFKIVGGNSGIQYRSRVIDDKKWIVGGYQADVDSSPTFTGINYDEQGRGILAERGQRVEVASDGSKKVEQYGDKDELQKLVKKEDWNDYRVVADGVKLSHYINGQLMSEVIDNQTDKGAKSGVLALQCHAGPPMKVQYKDLRIKELK